jgi:hypothetical protein
MIIEVPVSSVREDPSYPDTDTLHIYDHLKYALSRPSQFPLPAIRTALVDGGLVVTSGHKYLQIARELGYHKIRSIISSGGLARSDLLRRLPADVREVAPDELEAEIAIPVVRDYHVYFFDEPLSVEQQEAFVSIVAGFFDRLETHLLKPTDQRVLSCNFPFGAYCAEFEANIPIGDSSWPKEYLGVTVAFSRNIAHIASFQGARFLD